MPYLDHFEKAILQLEEALAYYHSDLAKNDPKLVKHLRAAVIQAFEFTYEMSHKMMRRFLNYASPQPDKGEMTFNDLIREAYGYGLLLNDLKAWHQYRKDRGTTSHTYNEEKAQNVFDDIPEFLREARYLLNRLQEKGKDFE